jgi:sialate O-acetylesterase
MKNSGRYIIIIVFILLIFSSTAYSNIKLPVLISDGMVLQRNTKITIWGWASSGEKITVKFLGKTYRTVTPADGGWKILLPPLKQGGPYSMYIKGENAITINDILVGDVWFCSGQSNMVLTMERVKERYPDEIAGANYPEIRNFFIPTASDVLKVHDDLPGGKWIAASPANVPGFGAVTYFFAKSIYKEYNVPVGIINSSVGGTPIEAWVSEGGLKDISQYAARVEKFRDTSFMRTMLKPVRGGSGQPVQQTAGGSDKGMTGAVKWYDTAFVPEGWHKFWLPGYWADQGVKNLNGVVWFRKEINVPASMTGKPARLFMGRIVDADIVYVNGIQSGSITYQYPPRRYDLPSGLLKPGKNIIVVRVTNNSGKGGFVPDKPYYLTSGGESIDLRGEWQYKVGQVFRPVMFMGAGPIFSMQNEPTGLYNTMVAPAIKFSIKGFLWYQGEANTSKPYEYKDLLTALIIDWRNKWNQGTLPFLYVQLPNFMEVQYLPSESQWAELRFAQFKNLSVANTAMAVTIDVGEWNDIHPLEKKIVGERLALAARKLAYGDSEIVCSGPVFKSARNEENKIIIEFESTGSGLIVKGAGELDQFAVAGTDRKFVWATAKIEDSHVVIWSDEIAKPAYVRYAWADNPEGANLYNAEGLPASPFEAELIR